MRIHSLCPQALEVDKLVSADPDLAKSVREFVADAREQQQGREAIARLARHSRASSSHGQPFPANSADAAIAAAALAKEAERQRQQAAAELAALEVDEQELGEFMALAKVVGTWRRALRKFTGALTREDVVELRRRDPVSARQLQRYLQLEASFGTIGEDSLSDDDDDGGDWDKVLGENEAIWR